MMPSSAQRAQRQSDDTSKLTAEVIDALKGFAAANGRVPCPALTPGGIESQAGGHCPAAAGYLPGPTLGVPITDAWGRPLRYAVATTYTNAGVPPDCPTAGLVYPPDAATTVNGLMLAMPCLVTDLRACGNASRYSYAISGAGSCTAPFASIGDGLAVVVWSDGADNTTQSDDLTTWPALPSISKVMIEAGR
jgi:hypothetical protein